MEEGECERMTNEELTRDVVGYEDIYTIDIFGNVIRVKDKKEMSQHKNKFGYMNVNLYKDGKQKQHKVHRLIAQAFIPNPQNKEQVNHIYGRTHLNATYEYGVTFERGTTIHYGDRNHVIISGTASINNKGEVMYPGDVKKQTLRMWENVEVLLNEAGASYDNVMQLVVYLRDISDFHTVKPMFDKRFPNIPKIFTLAPVCRPQWLIEMECVAITLTEQPQYNPF